MSKLKKCFVVVFLCVCTCFAFSACSSCKSTEDDPNINYEVSLDAQKLSMTLGDEEVLIARYTQVEGVEVSFSSADENIVTVDNYGRLTAVNVGTTTVMATYGTATAVCEITVGLGDMIPILKMTGVTNSTVKTSLDTFIDLNGLVEFNGKTYDDATFEYTLSDTTFGGVTDGLFYPAKTGTVDIYVVGTWRGITGESLTATVSATIIAGVDFRLNDGVSSLKLYTKDSEPTPFVITATANGANIPYDLEIVSGEQYIDLDLTKQTIESVGVKGEALIKISTEVDGENYVLEIPVTVVQTIYAYDKVVKDFSAIHGDTQTGSSLVKIMGGTVIEAYDESGNALTVKNNKVFGVKSSKTGKFTGKITVLTAEYGYEMNIEGYSGIFNSADDLKVFNTNVKYSGGVFSPIDETKEMQVWDGYYILQNNIDASEYVHADSGNSLTGRGIASVYPYGLTGTFDGQGYTVKGITFKRFGLFGYVYGGTVKNVGFTEVKYVNDDYVATIAGWINNAEISNVYIQLSEQTINKASAVVAQGVNCSQISNCIFDSENVPITGTLNLYGSLASRNNDLFATGDKTRYSNVYVISEEVLGYVKSNKNVTEDGATFKCYTENWVLASNSTFTPTIPDGYTEKDWVILTVKLEGVKQYTTKTQMQADNSNNYSGFSSSYWNVSGKTPEWKSANGYYEVPDHSIGDFETDWIN